jgi:NAD(P)-dependent dehydrogenase (short-subunit alcohol dehydrogenase family)
MSAPGKTFLITGATAGIGRATCEQLVRGGHSVLVHGRNPDKVANAVAELNALQPDAAVGFTADLSSMATVRQLGSEVAAAFPQLDGLLNNAGSFDGDYSGNRLLTDEGNEYTLSVNVLAPFLLTSLLLPCLRASGAGRVIISSSVSMGAAEKLSDLQLQSGYSAHTAYSLSKLCDAMLSQEMHAQFGDPPRLTFNAMDPTSECGMGCDTKMLRAGWGNWGAPATASTVSAKMLTLNEWATKSGTGFASRREVADPVARKALWNECMRLTGLKTFGRVESTR